MAAQIPAHAQAVIIGGGLIGCSVAYHLTKLGWKDVVLFERDELTSGSTWHAAANIHGLHDNNNISKLQYYTMQLYEALEAETGQSCGVYKPGSLYLAQTEDREHQLRIQAAKARYFAVEFHELSRTEAEQKHPLVNYDGIRCIMFEPDGGNVDPSGVTNAYAVGARNNGAQIHRFTAVKETNQRADGSWDVVTDKGSVHADIVINCAGLWAREVAAMAGFELPLIATEHQYLVTETIGQIEKLDRRLPSVADRDGEYYLRQEGLGLLVGAYEKDAKIWAEKETPQDFGHELFPDDLERIAENYMRACERLPVLESAGVKRVINGPMIWSPDAAALFGPVPELRNYYCCNGIIPGFSQSGGLGMLLAQWVVEGEPELDLFPWDLARYGIDWTPKSFVKARVLDAYAHRFKIHFPYEEREAGRPVKTRPAYQMQDEMGAVFGLNSGWEHPLWFAGKGSKDGKGGKAKEDYGFKRQAWFDEVKHECETLRQNAGLIDISNFAKYKITGKGAGDWLDALVANKVPREAGRSCLTPLIGRRGGIAGDFTITMLGEDDYWMVGSGMAERYHKRFFDALPRPGSVSFESVTDAFTGFNIAGPKSRAILQRMTNEDVSADNWKFMRSRQITVDGIDAIALRVSFTGDLGWELYCAEADQTALYTALLKQGEGFGLVPVGGRSLLSLRVEKGYGSWGREYSPEYWPQETGLASLIKLDKTANNGEFLNRAAYEALKDKPPREKLVMLEIETPHNADASGGEPIFTPDGEPVGRVSSGAYGFSVEKSLALGYVKAEFATPEAEFDIAVLGLPHRAKLLAEPPFDPKGERLRG